MDDAQRFLMGGKVRPAFSWPKGRPDLHPRPGDRVEGIVTEPPELQQQRDYDDGEKLLYWDPPHNTRPKRQLVITVQTDLNNPNEEWPEDDGLRRHYVRGELQKAVRQAVKDAGADDVKVGGRLAVIYTGDGPAAKSKSGNPLNPPHLWKAEYTPPTSASASFLGTGGGEDYQPSAYQATQQPAYQPPPQHQPTQAADPLAGMDQATREALMALAKQQSGR
jgi:hypothetical protein